MLSEQEQFAAKVASARAYYDNHSLADEIDEAVLVEPEMSIADVQAMVQQADAAPKGAKKLPNGPVAPVRRRGPASRRRSAPVPAPALPDPPAVPSKPKRNRRRDPIHVAVDKISDEQLLAEAGVELYYSTADTAQFFGKTTQWVYWGLGRDGNSTFTHEDGSPINPTRIGGPDGRRRFTLNDIRAILMSNYRRGNADPEELAKVLRRIRTNELGGDWREKEGWHKIRGKWVHPDQCEKVGRVWVRKKSNSEDEA